MNFVCKWPMKQIIHLQKIIYLIKDFNIIYNINQNIGEKYWIQKLIQVLAIYLPFKEIFLGFKKLKNCE